MAPISTGGLFVAADPVPGYTHGPSTQPTVVAHAYPRPPATIDDPWLPAWPAIDSVGSHHPRATDPLPFPDFGAPDVGAAPVVGNSPPIFVSALAPIESTSTPLVNSTPSVGEPRSSLPIDAPLGTPIFPRVGSSPNPAPVEPLTDAVPPPGSENTPIVGTSPAVPTFPVVGTSPSVDTPVAPLPPIVQSPVVSTSTPLLTPEPTGLIWLAFCLPLLRRDRSDWPVHAGADSSDSIAPTSDSSS